MGPDPIAGGEERAPAEDRRRTFFLARKKTADDALEGEKNF
jgi:hypothetical protein